MSISAPSFTRQRHPHTVAASPEFDWVAEASGDLTSQFGEDGMVAELFDRIGYSNFWCFEVGAADGLFFSNTKWLRDDHWNAVLIESGDDAFAKLTEWESERVYTIHETVGHGCLDRILAECGAPTDMDFGVIDIDGQDWHVWEGMEQYQPRVMLVEFAQQDAPVPERGGKGQAGRSAIVALGESKGYVPVAFTYVNALFVKGSERWQR